MKPEGIPKLKKFCSVVSFHSPADNPSACWGIPNHVLATSCLNFTENMLCGDVLVCEKEQNKKTVGQHGAHTSEVLGYSFS